MTFASWFGRADDLWVWLAVPALALASIWTTLALRGAPYARLGTARGARAARGAAGEASPAAAVFAAVAASWGAAGAVGAATAISLGGAGAIGWVWVVALGLVPLRYAETVLARTSPPGRRGASGALAARLRHDGRAPVRVLGWTLAVALAVSAPLFVAGHHGGGAAEGLRHAMPEVAPVALGLATALAAALVLARRGLEVAGWLALAALGALVLILLAAAGDNPSRALGALGRALAEMTSGAPSADAFVGATAGEVAAAAALAALPPLGAGTGVVGALHARAAAEATRRQAALAAWGPLVAALATTAVGVAAVATGAFFRPIEDRRPFPELVAYGTSFETASQRAEADRRHTGYMRVIDGVPRDLDVDLATERGLVDAQVVLERGVPADLAFRVDDGRVTKVLRPEPGTAALRDAPLSTLDRVEVEGEMLPRGAGLLLAAVDRGAGGGAARAVLLALLVLSAVAAAAFGRGLEGAFAGVGPPWLPRALALLPVGGLAAAAAGAATSLAGLGAAAAAVAAALAAVGIALRAREAAGA